MACRFQTIVHPTDYSDTSADAFAHALRIALAMRSKLYLVHVGDLTIGAHANQIRACCWSRPKITMSMTGVVTVAAAVDDGMSRVTLSSESLDLTIRSRQR